MSSIQSHRLKGNSLFESGQLLEASDAFQSGVHAFLDARSTASDDVEEFVKIAGNWLICLYQLGRRDACFSTARELLSTYPIIPKAYGVLGMCIVDELQRRQEVEAALDAAHEHVLSSTATGLTKKAVSATTCVRGETSVPSQLTRSNGTGEEFDAIALSITGTNGPVVEGASAGVVGSEAEPGSLAHTRPRTAEERRQDPHHYWVRLNDIVCTADDAHTYLCRAVSLAPSLQASLQPYLDISVRLISEQLFSAAPALERTLRAQRRAQCGDEAQEDGLAVLNVTCPAEDSLLHVPTTLATAPKATTTRVQMLSVDEPGRAPVSIPDSTPEAQSARRQYAAERPDEGAHVLPEQLRPTDFVLSGAAVPVRVCHSERGGLPRSLTVVRAAAPPFGVACWVRAVATTVGPDGTGQILLPSRALAGAGATAAVGTSHHIDPLAMSAQSPVPASSISPVPGASPGLTMGVLPADFDPQHAATHGAIGAPGPCGGGASCCVACAKEIHAAASGTTCTVCGLATYCSANCEAAYKARHDTYECAGLVQLQREINAAAEDALRCPDDSAKAEDATATTAASHDTSEGPSHMTGVLDLAGEAWSVPDLLHRVVPLTLAVYSGLCTRAPGWKIVSCALQRGAHRNIRALVPPTVRRVLDSLEVQCTPPPPAETHDAPHGTGGADTAEVASVSAPWSLLSLCLLCRLYQSRDAEHEVSTFDAEKLLLRHSCEPNCVWSEVTRTITTGRFIAKGEELTLAVDPDFPQHWPHQVRTKWWLRNHGFVCQCSRCLRESRLLNSGRGDLSDDFAEQLLTADALRKPKSSPSSVKALSKTDDSHRLLPHHPTHYFHPLVQKAVQLSRAGRQTLTHAVPSFHALRDGCALYLLPTHYLFEDLRLAECALAEATGQMDVTNTLTRESMQLLESLWPGATPSKTRVMEMMPQTFDCRRRHIHNRRMRRSNKSKSATTGDDPSSTTAPVAKACISVARDRCTAHEAEQSVVDRFMGSYRAWYL